MTNALLALATLATPADVKAPMGSCVDGRISVLGGLDDQWREALAPACEALATMPDRDPYGRLSIIASGRGLILEVISGSGKTATRRVDEPGALLPTLEALLTVPRGARAQHVSQAEEPEGPDRAPPPHERDPVPDGDHLSVSVGGTFGARLSGPQPFFFASPGGFFEVAMGAWAVAIGMRWDEMVVAEDVVAPVFEMDALSVSASVSRRWPLPFGRFDLSLSPRLISETQSYQPPTGERAGTSTDVRPAVLARLEVGRRRTRLLVDLDADVSPSRLRRELRIDPELPRLPGWSVGLAVGAAWGGP